MTAPRPSLESDRPASVLRHLTNGIYVIGVAHGGRASAFTAAWLTQVSFDPLLVALSINPGHASFPLMKQSRAFSVSVIGRGRLDLAKHFGTRSGRDVDKLGGVRWHSSPLGLPIVSEAAAWLDCRLTDAMSAGDHELVVARLTGGGVLDTTLAPMAYAETGDLDGSAALYPADFAD
jgi:flavin reductase (DIM6/NTAB) family NADH-FMN oxidoreductase RutF